MFFFFRARGVKGFRRQRTPKITTPRGHCRDLLPGGPFTRKARPCELDHEKHHRGVSLQKDIHRLRLNGWALRGNERGNVERVAVQGFNFCYFFFSFPGSSTVGPRAALRRGRRAYFLREEDVGELPLEEASGRHIVSIDKAFYLPFLPPFPP